MIILDYHVTNKAILQENTFGKHFLLGLLRYIMFQLSSYSMQETTCSGLLLYNHFFLFLVGHYRIHSIKIFVFMVLPLVELRRERISSMHSLITCTVRTHGQSVCARKVQWDHIRVVL